VGLLPRCTVQEREDLILLNNGLGFLSSPEYKQRPKAECALQIQVQNQHLFLSAIILYVGKLQILHFVLDTCLN